MVQDDNRLEWLALMQHYGAPTRLLDFTRSPYVACFFALEELKKRSGASRKLRGLGCRYRVVDIEQFSSRC